MPQLNNRCFQHFEVKKPMAKKHIRATHQQYLQIADLIRGKLKNWLVQDRPGYTEVATRCSKELGYPVSNRTVSEINKDLKIWLPITTERGQAGYAKWKGNTGKVEHLENEIHYLHQLVKHLYYELNLRTPTEDQLQQLAGLVIPGSENGR